MIVPTLGRFDGENDEANSSMYGLPLLHIKGEMHSYKHQYFGTKNAGTGLFTLTVDGR